MKKIIIIGTYPSNDKNELMLSECIDNLSNIGYHLMIVSHYPIPAHIQNKVNYCVYDKENILLPYEMTPKFWFYSNNFDIVINSNGHLITICKNMSNGCNFANFLGYEFFYYMESDNIFSHEDIDKLIELEKNMFEENKKMIFFKHQIEHSIIYESLIFGGSPGYFSTTLKLPTTITQTTDYKMSLEQSLEQLFYKNLSHLESDFHIINDSSQSFFERSEINKISHNIFAEVICTKNNEPFLWMSNSIDNKKSVKITINSSDDNILYPGVWKYLSLTIGDKITLEINDDGYVTKKNFDISTEMLDFYSKKGTITFK
jgi:hypothetical protein